MRFAYSGHSTRYMPSKFVIVSTPSVQSLFQIRGTLPFDALRLLRAFDSLLAHATGPWLFHASRPAMSERSESGLATYPASS